MSITRQDVMTSIRVLILPVEVQDLSCTAPNLGRRNFPIRRYFLFLYFFTIIVVFIGQ